METVVNVLVAVQTSNYDYIDNADKMPNVGINQILVAALVLAVPTFIIYRIFILGEEFSFRERLHKARISKREAILLPTRFIASALVFVLFLYVIDHYYNKNEYAYFIGWFLAEQITISITISCLLILLIISLGFLISKRLHDLNMPGYYVLGFFPIISWYIGYKVFQTGYKVLGVLVFFNITLALPLLLLISGDKGTNYYGMNPEIIAKYKKKIRKIANSVSINEEKKKELRDIIAKEYEVVEINERSRFIINEVDKLVLREGIDTAGDEELLNSRRMFFEKIVKSKIGSKYTRIAL